VFGAKVPENAYQCLSLMFFQRKTFGPLGPFKARMVRVFYFTQQPHCKTTMESVMAIELAKEVRVEALDSLSRYVNELFEERIGNVAASQLLDFFLEEIGPSIYNKAVADVQERMQARVADLSGEVFEDEFQYWLRRRKKVK
jgi:uncharacterized protein (DUF2164 family)